MVFWRRWSQEPPPLSGQLCHECGHAVENHPYDHPRSHLACAACLWEEDTDRRTEEEMCRRIFTREDSRRDN